MSDAMIFVGVAILATFAALVVWALALFAYRALIRYLCFRLTWWAAGRTPDEIIGYSSPYLLRWELARFRGYKLALHHILRSDDDRALHDHVSWHCSLILATGYLEHIKGKVKWRRPGQIIFRKARTLHRLELAPNSGGIRFAWTLWLRGPKQQLWGFQTKEYGWLPEKIYDWIYGEQELH